MGLDQQMRLGHLPQLAGVHHRPNTLADGHVLHQPTLPRRLDRLLHLHPHLPHHAGLDLRLEFRVCGVLVGKQLPQQVVERRSELCPDGRAGCQGLVERPELLVRRQRVGHRVARLCADAVSHLQLRAQLDAQLVELVARQRPGLHLVVDRQHQRIVVETVTLEDVVEHHQAPQVCQRLVAEERGQPHQRAGVAPAVTVQARNVILRCAVGLVERKVQHHRPGTAAPTQPVVGHLAHVLVEHLHLAPGAAPGELVVGEQAAVVRDAQLVEHRFAQLLAPIARVVVRRCAAQDGLDVHVGRFDRDDRLQVLSHLDFGDLARPVTALAHHVLPLAPWDG